MLGPIVSLMLLLSAPAADNPTDLRLLCNVGPLERSFAGQPSLVYLCSDDRSLVIVSAQKYPATEFLYTLVAQGDRHVIGNGSGSGDGRIVAAVYQDLRRLTEDEIGALIRATKSR